MVESVGGFTTRDGRSVLVTPGGKEVGSTTPEIFRRGSSASSLGSLSKKSTADLKRILRAGISDEETFAIKAELSRRAKASLPSQTEQFQDSSTGFTTIGRERQKNIEKEIERQTTSFQSLTPAEAERRALSGEAGFVGSSTPEGTQITFFPAQTPQVQRLLPKESNRFLSAIGLSGLSRREISVQAETVAGLTKQRRAEAIGGSFATGTARVATGIIEFVAEDVFLGGFSRQGTREEIREGSQLNVFDRGVFGKVKQEQGDVVQTAIGITATTAFAGLAGSKFVKSAKAGGLGVAGAELSGSLSPLKLKGGVFNLAPSKVKGLEFEETLPSGAKATTGISGEITPLGKIQRVSGAISKQSGQGELTRGFVLEESPAISIRAGGAIVEEGRTLSLATGKIGSGELGGKGRVVKGRGDIDVLLGESLPGGGSVTLSQPQFISFKGRSGTKQTATFSDNLFSLKRNVAVSEQLGSTSRIRGGELTNIDSFLGNTKKFRGKSEFDIARIRLSSDSDVGFISKKPIVRRSVDNVLTFDNPVTTASSIKSPSPSSLSKSSGTGGSLAGTSIGNILSIQTTKQNTLSPPSVKNFPSSLSQDFLDFQLPRQTSNQKQPQLSVDRSSQQATSPLLFESSNIRDIQRGIDIQIQPPITPQRTGTITEQGLTFKTPPPTTTLLTPTFKTPPPTTTLLTPTFFDPPRPTGFIFPSLPPAPLLTQGRTSRAKGKRKLRRTPSLIAIDLGLRAKRLSAKRRRREQTGLAPRLLIG